MFNKDYYSNLICNQPITYKGVVFNIVSLKEINKLGYEFFNTLLYPFMINQDCFDVPIDNVFLDGILKHQDLLKTYLITLKLILKFDSLQIFNNRIELSFKEEDSKVNFVIDQSNYEDISDIVLTMNAQKRIQNADKPLLKTQRQKDAWKKIQEQRQRYQSKDKLNIYDALSVCEFGGDYHISMEEILKWSLWKVLYCYKIRIGWKSYNDNLDIALVSGKSEGVSGNNHWYKQLMIQ